ncbi:MAG: hypothetical protein C0463_07175 [Idiomarina sp.]|nr:hypothetical protein [Idiomarina sp.]
MIRLLQAVVSEEYALRMDGLCMVANSYLFEAICEWRRWEGQRGKLLVLLLGFATVCALLTLSLRFGQILLSAKPAWLGSDDNFYTLAYKHEDGRQASINKVAVQNISDLNEVKQTSWLSFSNAPLESPNWTLRDPLVVFYESSFFSMTGVSELPNAKQGNTVWISERFWREAFQASPLVAGELLYHERVPHAFVVGGVLPASLNRLGNWQPDVWIPGDYLRFTTPFNVDSEIMVDRFLNAAPIYFGVFSSERRLDEDSLTQRLRASDTSVSGMSFASEGGVLQVYSGIELSPVERENMLAQWRLLIFLVVALGIVLTFNTFMVFTSRFLIYQKDYRIMRVIGAAARYQLSSAVFVAAVKLTFIALVSLLLLLVFDNLLSKHPTYQALLGVTTMGINYSQWLASWILISIVFLACYVVPLVKISKNELFDRAMGGSSSKLQKLGAQGNLVLQLTVALVSLNMALTFAMYQWQSMTHTTIEVSTQSFNASQRGSGLAIRSLTEGGVAGIDMGEVAVSFASFEQPQTLAVEDPNLPRPIAFNVHYVTRNYFNVLNVATFAGNEDWQGGIRINRAAADILRGNTSIADLLGTSLIMGGIHGQAQITGIVENVPHRGRFRVSEPMIYLSIEASAHAPQTATFFFSEADKGRITQALHTWLNREMIDPFFSERKAIAQILAQQDQAVNSLFISTVLASALIIASVLISLGYQIKARLRVERHEYGVLLAIGAPSQSLLLRVLRHTFLAFAVATPLSVLVLAIVTAHMQETNTLPIYFEPYGFILACFITLLLTIVTATVPLRRILKEPIFSCLRQG